jgi:hypothetical protein
MSCNSHRRTTRRRMRFLQSVYVQLLYIIRVSCDVLYKFCRMCFWQKHIYMFKDHIYLLFYSHSGARGGHAGAVMPGAVMPRAVMPGAVKPGAVMPGAVTPCNPLFRSTKLCTKTVTSISLDDFDVCGTGIIVSISVTRSFTPSSALCD